MIKKFFYLCFVLGLVSCKIYETDFPTGHFENLGVQLSSTNMQAISFAKNELGQHFAYFIVRGRPGHLIGYDMALGQIIADLELPNGAEGAIEMTLSTDFWLYIGASNGHLLRTKPGSNNIEDLGKALSGTGEIMSLEAGKNGEVFGGTFPTGKVFKYTINEGFSDLMGQIVKGESYVQRLRYDDITNTLYAGIGAHAHLIKIDLNTLNTSDILPEKYLNREFVYYMDFVKGFKNGNKLFAWVTNATERDVLIFDTKNSQVTNIQPSLDANVICKSPYDNYAYFTSSGVLYKADFEIANSKWIKISDCNEAKDMLWNQSGVLQILTKYGEIKTYNPQTSTINSKKIPVKPLPYGIQTLLTGPDGNIWSSGYLFGGNAIYNPTDNSSVQVMGLGQAEGMVKFKNKIFFGVYPKARLFEYDTNREWSVQKGNPKFVGQIHGQDRPFASVAIEDQNKIYWGTIPGYGKLGGALIEYNVISQKHLQFTEFLKDQSVSSICYNGADLLIGTTIYGGLGAKPRTTEGEIIIWDITKNIEKDRFKPLENTTAITYLGFAPDGKLWGFADATIFIYDFKKKALIKTIKIADIPANPSHIWRLGFLDFHSNGFVYGAADGKFFSINPKTYVLKILKSGVGLITKDFKGNYYTRDVENLWKYSITP